MSQPTPAVEQNPDSEKAAVLAKRLVEAYGTSADQDVLDIIAKTYEDVLSGATCTELEVDAKELQINHPLLFGPCASADNNCLRPTQPIAIQTTTKGSRLYLRIMDDAEENVAWHLRKLNRKREKPWKVDVKAAHLAALDLDPEKLPAIQMLGSRHLVIATGGPGTGKTHLIKGILTCALKEGGIEASAIRLAAPTNRAADRMRQSLTTTSGLEGIPPAQTLHSLLGDRDALAAAKLVIVDESSMADLTLIGRLLHRLEHPEASLVLAGDPDQLPSVEVGSVLSDLVGAETFAKDCCVKLENPHRFGDKSRIATLAQSIKKGDGDALAKPGMAETYSLDALWDYLEGESKDAPKAFSEIKTLAEDGDDESMRKAIALLARQRILCSHRVGKTGSEQLSKQILGRLKLSNARADGAVIMVLRNDHRNGIYNGDVGIVSDGNAHFLNRGVLLRIGLSSLPEYELAFASTIHKAQGSEYERVAVVLGESRQKGFMSKEMLYTGITRARKDVRLFETEGALTKCLIHQVKRASGLGDRLKKS